MVKSCSYREKIKSLKKGQVPFYEPKLEQLLIKQQKAGRLTFTSSYKKAISSAELIIVAVGTPSKKSGAIDLTYVKKSCQDLAPYLKDKAIVAIKSTVPPGIFSTIKPIIKNKTDKTFYLAALPEFLKEGTAVNDTLHPDRIVIGADNKIVLETLGKFFKSYEAPIVKTTPESAQMIKYSANAYLATRITFINQIADLCEHNNANINDVIRGIGYDQRIGDHYWYPGLGYGGSCFPKDVKELGAFAKKVGEAKNLVRLINQLNEERIPRLLKKYETLVNGWEGKTVAILGLSFKPHTNDTREAPALKIIPTLLKKGAKVKTYDPKARWQPENKNQQYRQVPTIKQVVKNADIIMILIEWPEIIKFNFNQTKLNKKQYFLDTRNQFNSKKLIKAGYIYQGIGLPEKITN